MIHKEYSEKELLFYEYAGVLGTKLDRDIISDEKYDKLYGKLLEWNLCKF